MKLLEMQFEFTRCISELINFTTAQGWNLTVGDFDRDKRVHGEWGEKKGYAAKYSVHKLRLAADLNLFIDGKYIDSNCEEYQLLGSAWKSMNKMAAWGGDFKSGDLNHFSFEYGGYK